jgi:hypothetical protein
MVKASESWQITAMALDLETSKTAVGVRLELTRRALGYATAALFASSLGGKMTPQKWNNYTSGRQMIPVEAALLVCRKFGITLDWIYRGDASALPGKVLSKIDELSAKTGSKQSVRPART